MTTSTVRGVGIRTVVWLVVATAAIASAASVGIGTPGAPGAGFFPFLVAVVLGMLALVDALIMVKSDDVGSGEEAAQPGETTKRTFVIGAVILYAMLLPLIGSIATIAVLTFVLLYVIEKRTLLLSAITAACTSGLLYYVFEVLLLVPLPIGVLWENLGVM